MKPVNGFPTTFANTFGMNQWILQIDTNVSFSKNVVSHVKLNV